MNLARVDLNLLVYLDELGANAASRVQRSSLTSRSPHIWLCRKIQEVARELLAKNEQAVKSESIMKNKSGAKNKS